MKTRNNRMVVILISILSLLVSPAASSFTNELNIQEGQWTISNNSSLEEDANWPIVKIENSTVVDPSTRQEVIVTTVLRRGPAGKDEIACTDKNGKITNKAERVVVLAATCVLGRSSLLTIGSNAVNGVTGFVRVYSNEYCSNGDCDYRKMTKINAWWKRNTTGSTVTNAFMRWGCNGACAVCPNNTPYNSYITSSTFTPTWNNLQTLTYTLTKSDWPIMKTTELGDHFGYSNSKAKSPTGVVTTLIVWAYLP